MLKVDGCKVRAVYYNDNLVLNFNIMLTRRLKWAQVSPQKFRAVLAEGKDQAVCAHLTLGDLDLMSAYRVLRKGGNRASGRDRGRCKEPFCSTTWELNVEQESKHRHLFPCVCKIPADPLKMTTDRACGYTNAGLRFNGRSKRQRIRGTTDGSQLRAVEKH